LAKVFTILGNGCLLQPASCVLRSGNAHGGYCHVLEGMNKAFRPGYPKICYEESTPEHLSCISYIDEIWLANNWIYQADFGPI
jgi:hypothetical protein